MGTPLIRFQCGTSRNHLIKCQGNTFLKCHVYVALLNSKHCFKKNRVKSNHSFVSPIQRHLKDDLHKDYKNSK